MTSLQVLELARKTWNSKVDVNVSGVCHITAGLYLEYGLLLCVVDNSDFL